MISEKQIMETISLNKHPFIVNMITSFKDERKLYILLEYVPGGEFFSYLRRVECFDADAARFYAACVAEVFGYLHAMNVIYRDLKPENVLIDSDGYPILIDYGFGTYAR